MSFQVVNIILSFLNLEMIMNLKARPGRPSQLLDRLGDVPLLPWFLLYNFNWRRRQPTSPAPSVCTRTRTGRHGLLRSPRGSCRFSNVKSMGEQISIWSPDSRHGELIRKISLSSIHFFAQIGAILLKGYNCLLMEYVGRYFQPRNVSTFTVLIKFYLPEAAESAELPTLIRQPERYMALSTQNSWTTSTLVTGTESHRN